MVFCMGTLVICTICTQFEIRLLGLGDCTLTLTPKIITEVSVPNDLVSCYSRCIIKKGDIVSYHC